MPFGETIIRPFGFWYSITLLRAEKEERLFVYWEEVDLCRRLSSIFSIQAA